MYLRLGATRKAHVRERESQSRMEEQVRKGDGGKDQLCIGGERNEGSTDWLSGHSSLCHAKHHHIPQVLSFGDVGSVTV